MAKINRYGLSRTISEDLKREVRRRCGFGCVRCGLAYYDYEHFDPDFKDAKKHDANGITLLCMQCNQKRARKTLSAETVAKANLNPKCKQAGFAFESLDFGSDPIVVNFAGLVFRECAILLRIHDLDVLSFRSPEEPGQPMLLSGVFSDASGVSVLKIVDNVWYAGDTNWDVEVKGTLTTIRRGPGDIVLKFRVTPPRELSIEHINMNINGYYLVGGRDSLKFSEDGENWSLMRANNAYKCKVGVWFC